MNPLQITFVDIETAPQVEKFEHLTPRRKELFLKKFEVDIAKLISESSDMKPTEVSDEFRAKYASKVYADKAGFFAEWAKVCCVSVGFLQQNADGVMFLNITSKASIREIELLNFLSMVFAKSNTNSHSLCAHNGKRFDFPILARRYVINGLPLPALLNTMGKKPWETALIDTMELWSFADFKHTVSLDMLAELFDLPSPKTTMNGKDVAKVFYNTGGPTDALPWEGEEERMQAIASYCMVDVVTLVNVFLKMIGANAVKPENLIKK